MKAVKVESRRDPFVDKAKTAIWRELATDQASYLAASASCHGYSIESLVENGYSHTDMIFLLLQGELPTPSQRGLLDALGVAICNPGPRHPATRSVMEAAVSKTKSPNFIPIGLMVLSGEKAAGSVEAVMRFLRLNKKKNVSDLICQLVNEYQGPTNDIEIAPGFGPSFEQREPLYPNLARTINKKFISEELFYLKRCIEFDELLVETSCGLKATALAAAIFLDLGFHPRSGPGLFQLLSAPGLLAHGLEKMNQPLSAMPFVADNKYHFVSENS